MTCVAAGERERCSPDAAPQQVADAGSLALQLAVVVQLKRVVALQVARTRRQRERRHL